VFIRLSENYNVTLVERNRDVEHVHILFRARPNTEVTKLIIVDKNASSQLIKRDFLRMENFGGYSTIHAN
jgi:putative transposase